MPNLSEANFETVIEAALLSGGPDDPGLDVLSERRASYGEFVPGGYHQRTSDDYDRALCLIPKDLFAFLYATQPQAWAALRKLHKGDDEAKNRLLVRLRREIERRGTLTVLRKGFKCDGQRFRLAYFRPASGLNPDAQTRYEANIFSVVRQLHYSEQNNKSLDLALFLNGLPLFSVELKNQFTGQDVDDAMRQYRRDRDPRESLFRYGRCLAHFAVDPELVYMTTELKGGGTRFLPFNRGYNNGAGNPPVLDGFATGYLWEVVWSKNSVLDLIQHFIHEVEEEDEKGNKTGDKWIIFPRYHQLDAVRRLVRDARAQGTGQRYLIQHSAGSGKSNSIAWLAHQLSLLHDAQDRRVFDTIVIITDRRILDRQLQRTVRQFEQVEGVVENIEKTSRQLKSALEEGKTIVVTTLQKFPVIAGEMGGLAGQRFAVIIDEAHSSQSGENTKSLKQVLAVDDLDQAESEDQESREDLEDRIVSEIRVRGPLPNVSYFAFTATPKDKTLELFGTPQPNGSFEPFSLYAMRQAIEENFIMDVLENYTTYQTYWKLLKTVADDPAYDRRKAASLLRAFVDLHPHAIEQKVEIIVEHFVNNVINRIGGRARGMIVTRSRLHAVRFKQAVDRHIQKQGYGFKALVAFSGTVKDGVAEYTERGMNGVPDSQTAETFNQDPYRLLIVANKFQTGFDQPLLHTMYVDKRLGGVNAVQTLSRLNRTHPLKEETAVLDFVNDAETIQEAFEPYYDRTILSEGTDPNLLHDLEARLEDFHFYTLDEVDRFAEVYFSNLASEKAHGTLLGILRPVVDRYENTTDDEQQEFRKTLGNYIRLYAFLSQILPFADPDLEKLYVFARLLLKRLPVQRSELPSEVKSQIDLMTYRLQKTHEGHILLERGKGTLEPRGDKGSRPPEVEEKEPLSQIIQELNDIFGVGIPVEEGEAFAAQLEGKLDNDPGLAASLNVNTTENARLTFDHVARDKVQEMMDVNFKLFKLINDQPAVAERFFDYMFDRYRQRAQAG